jgi:hypothetical protein
VFTNYALRITEKYFRQFQALEVPFIQPMDNQGLKRSFDIFFQPLEAGAKIVVHRCRVFFLIRCVDALSKIQGTSIVGPWLSIQKSIIADPSG